MIRGAGWLISAILILGRVASPAIAGIVLWRSLEAKMEWLAVASFILLIAVLVPNFLPDLINRLRPIKIGALEATTVPREAPPGAPEDWLSRTQTAIEAKLEELRKDVQFHFLPVGEQQLYAEIAALGVRVTALEEEVIDMRRRL